MHRHIGRTVAGDREHLAVGIENHLPLLLELHPFGLGGREVLGKAQLEGDDMDVLESFPLVLELRVEGGGVSPDSAATLSVWSPCSNGTGLESTIKR